MNKIDRMLHAIDNPGEYSDSQLEDIFSDPEVRDAYNILSKTKAASAHLPVIDVDSEWDALKASMQKRSISHFRFSVRKVAIVAAAVVTLGAIAGGLTLHQRHDAGEFVTVKAIATQETEMAATTQREQEEKTAPASEAAKEYVTFKNETLDSIASVLGEYYGVTPVFKNEDCKKLRLFYTWEKDMTLIQIAAMLNNFEQINATVTEKNIIFN